MTDIADATPAPEAGSDSDESAIRELVHQPFVQLWRHLLATPVDVDDFFFALGGTTYLFRRMRIGIERAYGTKLNQADLTGRTTVRALTDALLRHWKPRIGSPRAAPTAQQIAAEMSIPDDILQDRLALLWGQLLADDAVGIDDDFLALGGTPALSLVMLERVAELSGERLQPSDFDRGGLTIRRLAYALVERVPREPILQIQAGSRGVTPLFFIHGDVGGGGYYMRQLARGLGADRPVYAMQPHGIHGEDFPESVRAMASDHVRHLMEFWPSSPVSIGGHCGCGIVAWESAQQLLRAGREVTTLLLTEPPVPLANAVVRDIPLPRLPPESRRTPRLRGPWLFSRYRAIVPRYECTS